MKVIKSAYPGYCKGVQSALSKARDELSKARKAAAAKAAKENPGGLPDAVAVFTNGSLIHNRPTVDALQKEGIISVSSPEEAKRKLRSLQRARNKALKATGLHVDAKSKTKSSIGASTLIISAHGAPQAVKKSFEDAGFKLVDATCPVIKKTIRAVENASGPVVVIGNPLHSEVKVLKDAAKGKVTVIETMAQARDITKNPEFDGASIAVQSTFGTKEFDEIRVVFERKSRSYRFMNDICEVCIKRRAETVKIAQEVSAVAVMGSPESANAKALAELAGDYAANVFLLEGPKDIPELAAMFDPIGLVSSTSSSKEAFEKTAAALEDL